MGALTSRQNADVEETDIGSNHAYRYPPKSGNYFGTHFIMGGERFDTPQPEAYLFGENADLNFLGSRPTAFPYPPPQANEPTKTLKSLVNIRKESVRFVKAPDCATKIHGDGTGNKGNSFNIEFIYDSDAKCAITIYYFCTEEITTANGLNYMPRDPSLTSETYHCKRGVNQIFSQVSHIFNPNLFSDEDLSYNSERDVFPVAIHCVVEDDSKQSHTTICVVDHHSDGTYVLRALKQKIFVDGLCYLLQEIYGIENKNINKATNDDETDDNGSECVICMCDTRDTLILPCRHLCLCNSCAETLRYQANNCPICRAPFRALLQIKAVQKNVNGATTNILTSNAQDGDNIPPGYTAVSLIEALNGPPTHSSTTTAIRIPPFVVDTPDSADGDAAQAAEILNRSVDHSKDSSTKDKSNGNAPEIRMSVLSNTKDDGNAKATTTTATTTLTSTAITTSSSTSSSASSTSSSSSSSSSTGSSTSSSGSGSANSSTALRDRNSPRPKGGQLKPQQQQQQQQQQQSNRDSLKIINEKNSNSMKLPEAADDDSDAEKLSPLLNPNKMENTNTPLHIDGVDESIDDTDTDAEEQKLNNNKCRPSLNGDGEDDDGMLAAAEDSDYYTPEEPHTTILSPLCPENKAIEQEKLKENQSSLAPATLSAIKDTVNSLPGNM